MFSKHPQTNEVVDGLVSLIMFVWPCDTYYIFLFAGEEGDSGPDYANIESLEEEDEEDEGGQVRFASLVAHTRAILL